MKRETLLTLTVGVLLLLNLGTIGYLFLRDQRPQGGRPDKLIVEGLKLTPPQVEQFEVLKDEHRTKMFQNDSYQRGYQQELWALLRSDTPDTTQARTLINQWLTLEGNKRVATFDHFRKIRLMCTPEQRVLFDTLILDIGKAMMPMPRSPQRRPL
ncbi:MAG: periplasmic heavy metal sensor [Spirosomaceae bacterium]|jgi:Spy/CpxP family protein refolding chaperone|nr:periplasmic heavy metal sensor [Spirosomataceae bacterium]